MLEALRMIGFFTESQVIVFGITLIFMGLDILSGYFGAVINKNVDSSEMRKGFLHKGCFVIIILVIGLLEVICSYVANIDNSGLTSTIACAYVIVMEVHSIQENLIIAYPDLANTPLMSIFKNSIKIINVPGIHSDSEKENKSNQKGEEK